MESMSKQYLSVETTEIRAILAVYRKIHVSHRSGSSFRIPSLLDIRIHGDVRWSLTVLFFVCRREIPRVGTQNRKEEDRESEENLAMIKRYSFRWNCTRIKHFFTLFFLLYFDRTDTFSDSNNLYPSIQKLNIWNWCQRKQVLVDMTF